MSAYMVGRLLSNRVDRRLPGIIWRVLTLAACTPDKHQITRDFQRAFAEKVRGPVKAVVTSVRPGEGDSGNVYEHVVFDVEAHDSVGFENGWLAGRSLVSGERLVGGEVVILYQRRGLGQWAVTRLDLTRAPARP